MIDWPYIIVAVGVTGIVTSFISRWAHRYEASKAAWALAAADEEHYLQLKAQLREPVDWVIVGSREPGLGVVLMVGQEPVKFDMLRRTTGSWKLGPLGAKLPDYRLAFNGETDNFSQIRAATYEEALTRLMERRSPGVLRRPHVL